VPRRWDSKYVFRISSELEMNSTDGTYVHINENHFGSKPYICIIENIKFDEFVKGATIPVLRCFDRMWNINNNSIMHPIRLGAKTMTNYRNVMFTEYTQ